MNRYTVAACMLFLFTTFGTAAGAEGAEGFLVTPGGVQFRDLSPGAGEIAETGDVATIHLVGWLDDKGQKGREIFNSRNHGRPVSFVIGTDKVMSAWNEGVAGMQPGGRRLLLVPPKLGYGAKGVQDLVPPEANLILILDLVGLEKAP